MRRRSQSLSEREKGAKKREEGRGWSPAALCRLVALSLSTTLRNEDGGRKSQEGGGGGNGLPLLPLKSTDKEKKLGERRKRKIRNARLPLCRCASSVCDRTKWGKEAFRGEKKKRRKASPLAALFRYQHHRPKKKEERKKKL